MAGQFITEVSSFLSNLHFKTFFLCFRVWSDFTYTSTVSITFTLFFGAKIHKVSNAGQRETTVTISGVLTEIHVREISLVILLLTVLTLYVIRLFNVPLIIVTLCLSKIQIFLYTGRLAFFEHSTCDRTNFFMTWQKMKPDWERYHTNKLLTEYTDITNN